MQVWFRVAISPTPATAKLRARIPHNCRGETAGETQDAGGSAWENCCGDCRGIEEQSNGTPRSSLCSDALGTPPSTRVSSADLPAVSTVQFWGTRAPGPAPGRENRKFRGQLCCESRLLCARLSVFLLQSLEWLASLESYKQKVPWKLCLYKKFANM